MAVLVPFLHLQQSSMYLHHVDIVMLIHCLLEMTPQYYTIFLIRIILFVDMNRHPCGGFEVCSSDSVRHI